MKIDKALELSEFGIAYRVSEQGQILLCTKEKIMLFVNNYSIGSSGETIEENRADWIPVSFEQ